MCGQAGIPSRVFVGCTRWRQRRATDAAQHCVPTTTTTHRAEKRPIIGPTAVQEPGECRNAASDKADADSADPEALRKVHGVVVQLARLTGRHIARKDFATRIPAANATCRNPATRRGTASQDCARDAAVMARWIVRRSDRTGHHAASGPSRRRPSAWHLGFGDFAASLAGRMPVACLGRGADLAHPGRSDDRQSLLCNPFTQARTSFGCPAITRAALPPCHPFENQHGTREMNGSGTSDASCLAHRAARSADEFHQPSARLAQHFILSHHRTAANDRGDRPPGDGHSGKWRPATG